MQLSHFCLQEIRCIIVHCCRKKYILALCNLPIKGLDLISCKIAVCRLQSGKNRASCISWLEVVKDISNQGFVISLARTGFFCLSFVFLVYAVFRFLVFGMYLPTCGCCCWCENVTPSTPAVPNCCCSKGSAPYWSNSSFLMFDIRTLWRSVLSSRASECPQKLKMVG